MLEFFALPIVGFLVGMLIVSFGGGGGAVYVGILTAIFHVPPAVAASTSLATTIPTTAAGTFSHWKAGNINLRFGLTMLCGGVAGSVAGSLCSGMLPQNLYNKLTGTILVLLALQMLLSNGKRKTNESTGHTDGNRPGRNGFIQAVCFGLLGGIMSGLVGLSGGGPIVAGLMILGCGALETVGTSVLVLLGMAVTGFAMHLGLGDIDWKLVGLLASGTTCGALIGPLLLRRMDQKQLEKILQPVLFLMTAAMGGILFFK
ncbi:sulfite exporter TauE/SafE family protein [Caproiciproducens sp. NJN-50]|uniref:sulfite exporter TauE/SafE family protein n=1 Tax=Acutalibacteraceae TaxID=3082771 RepID=UPI000FFE025E|nr:MULTISPECIES: sulfite exporter TauE/SafE family protein [Acutalibacteraceae]QAT49057.1 sulfite exporter TauE/SafE family protein [Caproiciproducens sp. NJN-50]